MAERAIIFNSVSIVDEERRPIVRDLSVSVSPGQVLRIVGGGGSGKTQIARLIANCFLRRRGSRIGGSIDFDFPPQSTGRLGIVFDEPQWSFCNLRVDDEVAFVLEAMGESRDDMRQKVAWALGAVGLDGFDDRQVSTLSGGEMRRLSVAAALVSRPSLLVTDDLENSADPPFVEQAHQTIEGLVQSDGTAWVDLSRNSRDVLRPSSKTVVLRRGESPLVSTDYSRELVEAIELSVGLPFEIELARKLSPGDINHGDWWSARQDSISALLSIVRERSLFLKSSLPKQDEGILSDSSDQSREILLAAKSLTFSYTSAAPVLKDASIELHRGSIHALVGMNGSGKTTLARLLAGLASPASGSLYYLGSRVQPLSLRRKAFVVFQSPEYQFFTDTVESEIKDVLRGRPDSLRASQLEEALEELQLRAHREAHPLHLSVAERRRLAVMLGRLTAQPLLIVDEPTLGQDKRQSELLARSLRTAADSGVAVMVITHDYEFVNHHADRIFRIEAGTVSRISRSALVASAGSFGFAMKARLWKQATEAGLASGGIPHSIDDIGVVPS